VPALVVPTEGCDLERLGVVGSYSTPTTFVSHAGLANSSVAITSPGLEIAVIECGATPGLVVDCSGRMPAHVAGSCSLSRDEADQIATWIEDVRTRSPGLVYAALPAVGERIDDTTGRVIARTFSCAGFVHAAYEEGAGIVLLVPENALPEVERETVITTWAPGVPEHLVNRYLEKVGLTGTGPWRLLLPGYLFHALRQRVSSAGAAYQPTSEDASFSG